MATTTTTPNMNIPVPVPGEDPGPDWANNIVADMSVIDAHNHTTGNGVAVPVSGLNINDDLPLNGNDMTLTRSVRFSSQVSPLAASSDIGCVYESGVDLWYNDGSGNQVRLTQGGSPAGGAGSITGLPSGTASASYSAGTFTFQSATITPAGLASGPVSIGRVVASSPTVTLTPSSSQASSYGITLPTALPGSGTGYFNVNNAGTGSFNGTTGSGSVVLSSGPTLSGPTLSGPTLSGSVTVTSVGAGEILASDGSQVIVSIPFTGSGNVVRATSPSLTTPSLASPTLTGAVTVSSAGVGESLFSDGSHVIQSLPFTGSGNVVRATSATLTTPTINAPTLTGSVTITSVGAGEVLVSNGSQVIQSVPFTGSGNFVRATSPTLSSPTISSPTITGSPTFTGSPAGTITSSTYTPTIVTTAGSGGTPVSFSYIRIGNRVLVNGVITATTDSSGNFTCTITLPINPTSNFGATSDLNGVSSTARPSTSVVSDVEASIGNKLGFVAYTSTTGLQSAYFSVNFAYSCA